MPDERSDAFARYLDALLDGTRPAPDEDPQDGRLARKGQRWFFDYDDSDAADDEPVHRLGQHVFAVGEYVTVTDEDGRPLTYKVVEVQAAG